MLAEGLWDELAAHGVDVLACRAGATRTPNYEASQAERARCRSWSPRRWSRRALDSLGKRPSVVPGFVNRLGDVFMTRLLSRRAAVRFMGKTTRRLYHAVNSTARKFVQDRSPAKIYPYHWRGNP